MYRLGSSDQSVNKNNMLKNVGMQEKVSYQLVRLYDKFINNGMKPNQDSTIFNTFKRSIGSTMRTYLLLKTKVAKNKITIFDQNILNISEASYQRLNDDRFIHLIRSNNYALLPFTKILYRLWVLKYGY